MLLTGLPIKAPRDQVISRYGQIIPKAMHNPLGILI